jgi:transcriptional regulator with XRE-family HTH domain
MVSKEFKEILADFLLENRLSQTAFAKRIEIKQGQVSEWLRGKAKPGYDILKKIAVAFGVPADYLLGISEGF